MMKRMIDFFLQEWKNEPHNRKPLVLRGARQVGKTHAVRAIGKTFPYFVEVNVELDQGAQFILREDLNPKRIVQQLAEHLQCDIVPGKTLLFLDEIQVVPQIVTALRYFYELMPELHVITAGSLLDFAIEREGMPVGRVNTLYMYPMSFFEFLVACGNDGWARLILEHDATQKLLEPVHEELLKLVGIYVALGGMPEAINTWINLRNSRPVRKVHAALLESYQNDFDKYAAKHQVKYVAALFGHALTQIGRKFIFSKVGDYKKRELEPGLELLQKAGVVHTITRSSGQGIPLGAQLHRDDFKVIFLDVGLGQAAMHYDVTPWLLDTAASFINKGEQIEAFVGQELLAYADPIAKERLFYWCREERNSQAEVDYLLQCGDKVVPIEVKSGKGVHLKSMQSFLESHPQSPYGIRFSTHNFSIEEKLHSLPLYAIAKQLFDQNESIHEAMLYLIE